MASYTHINTHTHKQTPNNKPTVKTTNNPDLRSRSGDVCVLGLINFTL